jgi:hypothetical protein
MKHLSLFDGFNQIDESYKFDSDSLLESKINQMFSLKNNGCSVGYSMDEFKNLFRSSHLLESHGYDESEALLEKAYNIYELGMLEESKSHWFDNNRTLMLEHTKGIISYLEFEGNILLFKEGEAFMIKESSLKMMKDQDQAINEGIFNQILDSKLNESDEALLEWSLFDNPVVNFVSDKVKGAVEWTNKNVVQPAKKIVKEYVIEPLKTAYNALTAGAKKLYDFAKQVWNAISTFLKEITIQDILFYVSVALQVIAGIISFIPAAGTVAGPVLLIIAGAIQVGTGVWDVFDGIKIVKECPVNPIEKAAPEFVSGGVKLLGGSVSLLLGINDITTSAKAAVPGAALTSTAVATPAKAWVGKTTKALGATGAAIGMFETLIKYIIESIGKAGTKVLSKTVLKSGAKYAGTKAAVLGGSALTKATSEIIGKKLGDYANSSAIPMLCIAGKYALGWLWDLILDSIAGIGKILNGLMDLPKRVNNAISNFNKEYSDTTLGWIVGGALKAFVSPVTKVLEFFCEKTIKPMFKPVTDWMVSLGKHNKSIIDSVNSKPALKAAVSGGKIPQPKGTLPSEKVELTSTDKQNLAKIQASDSGKKVDRTIAKEGGFFNDKFKKIQAAIQEKVKKQQMKLYNDKFPGIIINKSDGEFLTLNDGTLCFKYKSKSAHGTVVLYNNGRYQVKDGPNEGTKGNYTAKKNIDLQPPKEGFKKPSKKKNESRNYIQTFEGFSFF